MLQHGKVGRYLQNVLIAYVFSCLNTCPLLRAGLAWLYSLPWCLDGMTIGIGSRIEGCDVAMYQRVASCGSDNVERRSGMPKDPAQGLVRGFIYQFSHV